MHIVQPSATLEFITPNAAQFIERAGRTCYKSEDRITQDSAKAFIEKLKSMGHLSVFEHAYATFRVICDRGVSHEIVRHRLASYSQESTRYCNYGSEKYEEGIAFIQPRELRLDSRSYWWYSALVQAEQSYLTLIKMGVSPQTARSVLPNSLKTEIVWTANFREWLTILAQRAQPPAHPDMVEIVGGFIKPALIKECPEVFGD